MPTRLHLALGSALFALAGCGGGAIGDLPVEIRDIPLGSMLGSIVLWVFIGVVLGLIAGPAFFLLLRSVGAYRLDGRLGWWLRLAVFLLMFLSFPFLGGALGFWEGTIRATETGVRDSPLGKDLLPRVGEMCADCLIMVDGVLGGPAEAQELDLQAFLGRVDGMQDHVAVTLSGMLLDKWRAQNPDMVGTALEKWAEFVTPRLAKMLVERTLQKKLDEVGLERLLGELRQEAARRQGRAMPRAELGGFIADRIVIPGVLQTLTGWLRGPQKMLLILAAAATLLPVALFWLIRRARAPAPGP